MRNNKGITLIALVITIIVLLILAGVSIAMLTGDNGILNQATNAKNDTKEAEVVERINMELQALYGVALAEPSKTDFTTEIAASKTNLTGYATVSDLSGTTITITGVAPYTNIHGTVTIGADAAIDLAEAPAE